MMLGRERNQCGRASDCFDCSAEGRKGMTKRSFWSTREWELPSPVVGSLALERLVGASEEPGTQEGRLPAPGKNEPK